MRKNKVLKISGYGKAKKRVSALMMAIMMILGGLLCTTGCDAGEAAELVNDIAEQAGLLEKLESENAEISVTASGGEVAPAEGSYEEWVAAPDYPAYVGTANVTSTSNLYAEINAGQPFFTEEERISTDAFEDYSELDSLGRCGAAFANLCHELMPTEARTDISSIRPSGWHSVKYDSSLVAGESLWNRSHLIAFSLAGENANEKNLITGTSLFNQTVMQIFESAVLHYLQSSDNHVLYRVTPVYEGDELVARGVLMEAYSVEDHGLGICFNVFCYNVQPGISIDYKTGESCIEGQGKPGSDSTSINTEKQEGSAGAYLLNVKSKKFHLPDCSDAKNISESNRKMVDWSRQECLDNGYSPCGSCKP